ncbi:hypothetical protein [Botryobacter ruber]|uniref:hypothetical protein n=1 Tax=Botryobacter ruber TaxID=2171629 RepID=UPI000E0C817B|nr:hypothetical protein [Botryobacter ruber]
MASLINHAPLVEKEQIPSFHFSTKDVLTDPEAQQKRRLDLDRASSLGNAYHGKVEITFQPVDGEQKRVETTVWCVDDKYLVLKAGCAIPVTSIIGIEFF